MTKLTATQAAAKHGVCVATLRKYRIDGLIKSHKTLLADK